MATAKPVPVLLALALALPWEAFARSGSANHWELLAADDLSGGAHRTRHAEIFEKYAVGLNSFVLAAIDRVQATAMDGGGYYVDPLQRTQPPESPIGYPVALFGQSLLTPPRKTSYCTGATYAVLIEALDAIYHGSFPGLSPDRAEAMRMQELDGSRRQDGVKFWGRWNGTITGPYDTLVGYSGMGQPVRPEDARAGDFMSIHWKNGLSHCVVFLGWRVSKSGKKSVVFWSSNEGTNGLGDREAPLSLISGVKIVRLTNPDALASFDITGSPPRAPAWDPVRL